MCDMGIIKHVSHGLFSGLSKLIHIMNHITLLDIEYPFSEWFVSYCFVWFKNYINGIVQYGSF